MKKRIPRRILTVILSVIMLLALVPATAQAAEGETTSSGIELSKTVTLENDGTYTIDLEAYATGETTTTTTESSVPLDIVLVIDQSGSMAYNDSGSSTNTESDRRYTKLKTALNSFVSAIQANAASTGADHRIAIAGFASDNDAGRSTTVTGAAVTSGSDNSKWVNTGLYINGTMTPYGTNQNNTNTSLTSTNYKDALVSANTDGSVTSSITTAISNMNFSGGTYTEYGLLMAQGVFENNSATYTYTDENGDTQTGTRKRIVILFTDGETNSDIGNVLSASNKLKSTYNATVYCVGFGSSVGDFLSYISSNYGSDASYSSSGWFSSASYSGTSNNTTKYSMLASSTDELSKIFETISSDATSSSTTVTLDENSVMKDIMGDGFILTDDSAVTIKTVEGTSDGTTVTWGNETTNSASYTISDDKTTVSVTGFDYADKYISSGHAGEKICVTITGVLPTTSVTTDEAVNTNAATSGIYATADATETTATFEQPQTIITKKLYVLDYAKEAELTGLDQDTSVTGIVSSYQKVTSDNSTLNQSYGASTLSSNTLTYTPTTTNWNGYDSLYVFGQTTNTTVTALEANSNGNLWSKVSVIPANNVYYEDDFVTTYTDETKTETSTVGIVYTGDWTVVSGDTSTGNNTETANGDTYGWETSLSDDDTYSDGTAHAAGATTAKATFTFTGTGVDIYSRTDMYTGNVKVTLKGTSEGNTTSKVYICDNESVSGTYYQIPTVSFEDLEYDTYTVTIKVATNATESDYTYYLDGVRVYNPLGTVTEEDGDSYEAYKADNELNAVFTEVRNILIDADSFTADYDGAGGVVFIDYNVYATTTDDEETDSTEETETENSTSSVTTIYDDDGNVVSLGTYVDLGPKNEVYLAAGQSIAFKVNDAYLADGVDAHFYLGLKSADGLGTEATVTNGTGTSELTIKHSTDLYYEITPTSDGYIMVKNTDDNLLSITKLRVTSAVAVDTSENVSDGESTIALLGADEVDEIMVYAASFDSLATVASTDTGVEEDSFVDTEIDTETDVDTETVDVVEDLDEDDIVIDNTTEDANDGQTEEPEGNSKQSSFSSLFNSIRNWFNGRR